MVICIKCKGKFMALWGGLCLACMKAQDPTAQPEGEGVASSYGRCPICGDPVKSRERRLNGNDHCERGHVFPSRDTLPNTEVEPEAHPPEGEGKAEVVKSCDTCDSQEDNHYCLLHTTQVKNMNIHVCDDWREAHPQAIPANTDGERIAMVARLGIMGAYADLDTFAELWRCYIPYGKSFDDKTWRALMDRAIQLEKDGEL